MCGIFGWVRFGDGLAAGEIECARAATKTMVHRGPDGFGEWTDRHVYLGHQRLSILDLTDAAAQPFLGGDRYVLAFNGEIYNYIELRQELEREGRTFHTDSDTEVLLHVLAAWGVNGLRRLDGMFAGALHDRETGEHLLFRDPLGQKPLYVHIYDGGVVFGSELRSLLSLPQFRWQLDRQAFRQFLAHSYYPRRSTPIAGVEKLLPGCLLRIGRQTAHHERWWESTPGADPLDLSFAEARSEFEKLFDRSCRISMRSDVPVGVFLSGGIDSTLVLDSCHDAAPAVQAFSVSMAEADYDESAKAAVAAAQIGVAARSVLLDEGALHASFTELMEVLDEPHGDPGYVNTYFLAQACRPHITVALAGDGADELFAGYAPFAGVAAASVLRHLPAPVAAAARAAAGFLPATDGYLGLQFKALAYLQGFPSHPPSVETLR
ncbi:MAG: asparagine synthase (glutamine-hydrolyzing), partial [Proteobacteria bacterium]|nr:asparagine synthase (glutamine-hydrolyzing) [Pseudomonadota bacterium]